MNIWQFQDQILTRLNRWALFSIGTGLVMSRSRRLEIRGTGKQFVGWGLVNALIASAGKWFGKRRQTQRSAEPDQKRLAQRERRNLSRLLWVNAGLDIFYILGGALLLRKRGKRDKSWLGQGLGIILQGGFLFFFDLGHALQLESTETEIREGHPDA